MLTRYCAIQEVTVAVAVADSDEVVFANSAMGEVHVPAGSSITTLTWYSSPESGGTYLAAQDSSGNAVTQTVAAEEAYPIPLALSGCHAIKAIGDAAGTITVSMKA